MAKKETQEMLASVIADNLNKLFKDRQVAYIMGEESPTDLVGFVSTGSSLLDLAISNRPHGGIALGRITELTGLEGSGKSLVAAHILANVQKQGGVAVLIDTEAAVNWDFFDSIGLDRSKNFVYSSIDTVEDAFDAIVNIIETVRKSNKDKPVVIVLDSVAGASTKQEISADFDRAGYATGKAIILSTAMRKITNLIAREKVALVLTNQLRQKLNAMPFSDPWTTSGGKAIAFHSSTRVRLNLTGKIKKKGDSGDIIIGVNVKAQVIKNRLGPPMRTAEFDIYFDRGIDDESSWFKFLKDTGVFQGSGAHLRYEDEDGNEYRDINSNTFREFISENEGIREELYLKMCNSMVMQYNSEGLTDDDIEIDQAEETE